MIGRSVALGGMRLGRTETVHFDVDLSLIRELGERLISRDEVAVVELIKNSFDADATNVTVEISDSNIRFTDNGMGMDEKEIRAGWLTIGSGQKRRKKRTNSGRRVLGEKGIGRFAALRLGRDITIVTRKKNKTPFRLRLDWSKARAELEMEGSLPLNHLAMELSMLGEAPDVSPQGTTIAIDKLNGRWGKGQMDRLQSVLSSLVDPATATERSFSIKLIWNGKEIPLETSEPFGDGHYALEGGVSATGELFIRIRASTSQGRASKKFDVKLPGSEVLQDEELEWVPAKRGGCGPFNFSVRVWDLDDPEMRGHRSDLKRIAGISLVRDGFRVARPDSDWLGLNLRRVQNPTMRLSTNQIVGFINVSSDASPYIIDKTDREGVLDNGALRLLRASFFFALHELEKVRWDLRRRRSLGKGAILSYLDTTPLRAVATDLPRRQRDEVQEFAEKLDDFRTYLEDWILGRDRMATMGLLSARLLHEARNALMKISDNYPLVEDDVRLLAEPLRTRLIRLVDGARLLTKLFDDLDPFVKFRAKRRQDVRLRDVVKALQFLFAASFSKQKIVVTNSIGEGIVFRATPSDVYVMLANLLDNSIYWLARVPEGKRFVKLRAQETAKELVIEVADSGPGVEEGIRESVFLAGFTTKPSGTGLGLSIVKDVADSYGGRVEVSQDEETGGALFRVILPYRGNTH